MFGTIAKPKRTIANTQSNTIQRQENTLPKKNQEEPKQAKCLPVNLLRQSSSCYACRRKNFSVGPPSCWAGLRGPQGDSSPRRLPRPPRSPSSGRGAASVRGRSAHPLPRSSASGSRGPGAPRRPRRSCGGKRR